MTTVIAVRTALNESTSQHADTFKSLLDNGKVHTYKSLNPTVNPTKRKFGPTEDDYIQFGKLASAFRGRKLPTPKELQEICEKDLPAAQEYFGNRLNCLIRKDDQLGNAEETKEQATTRIIGSLADMSVKETDGVLTFPSKTLHELRREDRLPPAGVLRETITDCTILPGDECSPIFHSREGMTTITALSGSIVWVVWPSTEHNLTVLQNAYDHSYQDANDARASVANDLENGVIVVQSENDGLQVPSLCPMMCLAIEPTVLTWNTYIMPHHIIDVLQHLPLLHSWYMDEKDSQHKQSDFIAAILKNMDVMLNGDPEDNELEACRLEYVKGGPLHVLLQIWDSIKDDLASMMGPAHRETMETIWEAFLREAKGRECWICGKRIPSKAVTMEHFRRKHWLVEKVEKRVEFAEEVQGNGQRGLENRQQEQGIGDEHDMDMDIDMDD